MILGKIPEECVDEMKDYFTCDYMSDDNVGEFNCLIDEHTDEEMLELTGWDISEFEEY